MFIQLLVFCVADDVAVLCYVLRSGLLKDSLRKYWLEQIRGMETNKGKTQNKTQRELADMETVRVCVVLVWELMLTSNYTGMIFIVSSVAEPYVSLLRSSE